MKKKLKIICMVLCCLLSLLNFTGCSHERYVKQYMDAIEVEYSGYSLVTEKSDGALSLFDWRVISPTVNVQGKDLNITIYEERKGLLEEREAIFYDYQFTIVITVDNNEITVTNEYMKEHNSAYAKIIKMWSDELDGKEKVMYSGPVFVYDDNLFITFHSLAVMTVPNWQERIPMVLFRFDVNDYSIKYAGYYDKYDFSPYILKNN